MALFTASQADISTTKTAQSEYQNGTFKVWTFKVVDSIGNIYTWEETDEKLNHALTPSEAQISTYIKTYLTGGSHADGGGTYPGVEKITTTKPNVVFNPHKSILNKAPGSTPRVNPNAFREVLTNGADAVTVVRRYSWGTFTSGDTTPNISAYKYWQTHTGTLTITDFDGGILGDIIYIKSKGTVTFDVTGSGLKGGDTDLVTADGDLTCWLYDGTDWLLISFTDMSDNLS